MINYTRLINQQILYPRYNTPEDLVNWMGAIQAQDYTMVKWAIALRLKSKEYSTIKTAIDQAKIIRTHVLRPTWHFVSSEDIIWMIDLSKSKIKSANESRGKTLGLTEDLYIKVNNLLEFCLRDNNHLTKQEIGQIIGRKIGNIDQSRLNRFLIRAEIDNIICSGIDRNGKPTYALFWERIKPQDKINKEDALARLCTKYFQSHSFATLEDFTWWSGLSLNESKEAINLIRSNLIEENIEGKKFYIFEGYYDDKQKNTFNKLVLLPPYDEYLISYKHRTSALDFQYYSRAFTNYGIFYPVILYNGKIIGNWRKVIKKKEIKVEYSFFDSIIVPNDELEYAITEYIFAENLINV